VEAKHKAKTKNTVARNAIRLRADRSTERPSRTVARAAIAAPTAANSPKWWIHLVGVNVSRNRVRLSRLHKYLKQMLQSSVPRPFDHAKREELLTAASLVLARTGVVDTSLRALAVEMGTSARMLVYYFGSKEQLILDVLTRQQRNAIPATDDLDLPTSVAAQREWCFEDWQACTRGERRDTLRVVLQVFGAACGVDSPYRDYTWDTLSLLTRNSQARLQALGMPSHVAETRSRIALAAFQGFIIEYFTAPDPSFVDDTFARFVNEFLLAPFTSLDSADGPR
jgi:AcrR family transcriptional regulator